MKNTFTAFITYLIFFVVGNIMCPLAEGEKMYTTGTFIMTGLLFSILVIAYDILDTLKNK